MSEDAKSIIFALKSIFDLVADSLIFCDSKKTFLLAIIVSFFIYQQFFYEITVLVLREIYILFQKCQFEVKRFLFFCRKARQTKILTNGIRTQ